MLLITDTNPIYYLRLIQWEFGKMTEQLDLMKRLSKKTDSKIVFLVMDGIGGVEHPDYGTTALGKAKHPNLDKLAENGLCGFTNPIMPGITPGSGPAHVGLFG